MKDQRPAPDQRIPNKDGSVSTAASDVEAGAAICEFGVNTVAVEADDFRSKITQITQVILVLMLKSLLPSLVGYLVNPFKFHE